MHLHTYYKPYYNENYKSYYTTLTNLLDSIRGVPIWLLTDIPITDMNQVLKLIKHNRSDIMIYYKNNLNFN